MWKHKNINYSKYYGMPAIITYIPKQKFKNNYGILLKITDPNKQGTSTIILKTEYIDKNHTTCISDDLIDLISIKNTKELTYKKKICKNVLCDKMNEDCFQEISSFIDYEIINI